MLTSIVDETGVDPRNSVSVPLSSPGATSNQFNKDFEFVNCDLQGNSGTSSMVNLGSEGEEKANGEVIDSRPSKLVTPDGADPQSPVDYNGSLAVASRVRFTSLDDSAHSESVLYFCSFHKLSHFI